MTLVDVIVGAAIFVTVFVGLFGIMNASLKISGLAKLRATATEVAESQMEYLRSLPYDSIGTLGGIPAGLVPQNATTTNGGLIYNVRTYVEYADDSADGSGAADTNGIVTDYKHLKVTVSYTVNGVARDVTLVSNASPNGIESTTGGGTLVANIVNALGVAVPGATVRIQNASTSPTIDLTTFSDSFGSVNLPGAPTSTSYRISVSKTGYSSAQTYARDATNVNPTPGYLTVVGGSTTSSTFAIDLLTTLIIRTFSPTAPALWADTFSDLSGVTASSNVQAAGGSLTLAGLPGTYAASGFARSTTTAPAYLSSWTNASSTISVPAGTTALVSVADASGTLIPDAVLPGNAAGFSGTITLSGISTSTYPGLRLVANFSTADVMVTPSIADWRLGYDAGPTPLPNVPVTLTGSKTIGSTSGGASIYKTTVATTTDASGVRTMTLEWDLYTLLVSGFTVVSEDPESPYEMLPGTTIDARIILTP